MEAGLRILQSVDLNHASHFSAILGWDTRRINAQRLHIVRVDSGPEARRAIVSQRNAIDHKLRLVLRAARMQHGISLIQPAWLRVHQVLQGASWNRTKPRFDLVRADLADGAGLVGIDQRIRRGDRHGFLHRRELKLKGIFGRDGGMNVNRICSVCKSRVLHFNLIYAIRQPLHRQVPVLIGGQGSPIPASLADDLYGCPHARPAGSTTRRRNSPLLVWQNKGRLTNSASIAYLFIAPVICRTPSQNDL